MGAGGAERTNRVAAIAGFTVGHPWRQQALDRCRQHLECPRPRWKLPLDLHGHEIGAAGRLITAGAERLHEPPTGGKELDSRSTSRNWSAI